MNRPVFYKTKASFVFKKGYILDEVGSLICIEDSQYAEARDYWKKEDIEYIERKEGNP